MIETQISGAVWKYEEEEEEKASGDEEMKVQLFIASSYTPGPRGFKRREEGTFGCLFH